MAATVAGMLLASRSASRSPQHPSTPSLTATGAITSSVSPIHSLPADLLIEIAANHVSTAKDLNALALACGGFYLLTNPILYQHNLKKQRGTAAVWATIQGNIATLNRLKKHGADFDAIHKSPGCNIDPLCAAICLNQNDALCWLLENMSSSTAKNNALMCAIGVGDLLVCHILKHYGVSFQVTGSLGLKKLIQKAFRNDNVRILGALTFCYAVVEVVLAVEEEIATGVPVIGKMKALPSTCRGVRLGKKPE